MILKITPGVYVTYDEPNGQFVNFKPFLRLPKDRISREWAWITATISYKNTTLMSVIPIVMGICPCPVTSRTPITDTDIVGTIWNSRGVFDVSHGCQMNDM